MFLTNKKAWKGTLKNPAIWIMIILLTFMFLFSSCCRKVNKKRAVQFYNESVKNFPNENIE